MVNPVFLSSGNTYERDAVLKHLTEKGPTDPQTDKPVDPKIVIENIRLKTMLDQFKSANPQLQTMLIQQKDTDQEQ